MGARNWVLLGIAALVIIGLAFTLFVPADIWPRVFQFFTGFVLPLVGGVAALIAGNVAVEKITGSRAVPGDATKVDPSTVYKP